MTKASEVVADRLRARIASGELKPGDALPTETVLMHEHGVARPTMREAVRILESDGLITVQRGVKGGARVQELDLDVLARRAGLYLQMHDTRMGDLREAQGVVEPGAIVLAAERRTKRDVKQLRAIITRLSAADTAEGVAAGTADFHLCLFLVSGNRTLALLSTLLRRLVHQEYRERLERHGPEVWGAVRDSAVEWYARLVDLIEAGEAEAARAWWIRHAEMAQTFAAKFIESRGRDPLTIFPA